MSEGGDEDGDLRSSARTTDAEWLQKAKAGSILNGVLLLVGAHAAGFFLTAALAVIIGPQLFLSMGFIGVTQLVYVVPLVLWMNTRAGSRTVKGVLLGASLTLLLNAACLGIALGPS